MRNILFYSIILFTTLLTSCSDKSLYGDLDDDLGSGNNVDIVGCDPNIEISPIFSYSSTDSTSANYIVTGLFTTNTPGYVRMEFELLDFNGKKITGWEKKIKGLTDDLQGEIEILFPSAYRHDCYQMKVTIENALINEYCNIKKDEDWEIMWNEDQVVETFGI